MKMKTEMEKKRGTQRVPLSEPSEWPVISLGLVFLHLERASDQILH